MEKQKAILARKKENRAATVATRHHDQTNQAEEEIKPKPIPVKQAKFLNDPKISKRIKIGKPLFKREVRLEKANAGYIELL